jgi:hypothetical protein
LPAHQGNIEEKIRQIKDNLPDFGSCKDHLFEMENCWDKNRGIFKQFGQAGWILPITAASGCTDGAAGSRFCPFLWHFIYTAKKRVGVAEKRFCESKNL